MDDYVEIRPESEERIRSLVEAGRLALGPWQTLMDEFLVDGETTLRNLEAGMRRAEQLGGPMRVGYLPDMFGHVAQMPQILRAAGIETAVVWRGVPAAVDFHRFVWEGIDGSSVVAEYLPGGYGNAAYIFDVPGPVDLRPFEERFRPWFGSDPVLGMVGTDHKRLVHDFSARVPDGATVGTLGEYLADAAPDGLFLWRGELRSAARANLLPGVVSARIDLKAACARAERWLERYAEPLQALYGGTDRPEPFLAQAWTRMFQNSAHDSICGCSTDDVSAQVLARYAEAEHIGRELAQRAVAQIAAEVPRGAFAIVNPSPRERTDLVELEVVVPDEWEAVELELPDGTRLPTQEVRREPPFEWETKLAGADVAAVIARRLHGREIFGRIVNGFRIEGREAILQVGDEPDPEFLDVEQLVGELSLATAEGEWTLRVVAQPKRTIVAAVPAPPLGWTSVRPVRVPGTVPGTCPNVDVSSLTRIVRGKDIGDSYNYAAPADDVLVDVPTEERLERVEDGPLRRVDVLHRTYVVGRPERRDADALRAAGRRIVRPGPARARQHLRRPARARARATARACGELACRGSVRGGRAQSRGGRRPRRGRRPDVSGLRLRRRGRNRAPPRPRHRVRGGRRRARADRVALDRLHQPQREPVARRARRPRDPDPGGTTPRPPFLLVRVLPERRLDRRTR